MRPHLFRAVAIAGVASAVVLVGALTVSPVRAQTRITVPGAGPLYYPSFLTALPVGRFYLLGTDEEQGEPLTVLQGYDLLNHMIGENWYPGSTAQVVNYPASIGLLSGSLAAPGTNAAVAMGRVSLDDQIKNAAAHGDPVVIAGLSEGTIVINRELAYLATDPDAPPADQLSFAMFSGPEIGLVNTYLPLWLTVPLIDYTVHRLADSQYDLSVVFHQYDAWADIPDRPWNLLALINSLFGTLYFHNNAAVDLPSDAVEVSKVTSVLGGTTTTYMIPSSTVPLLMPLQQLGFPKPLVDGLNSVLKPIIDAGYSRLTPDAGPYFAQGQLRSGSSNDAASTQLASTIPATGAEETAADVDIPPATDEDEPAATTLTSDDWADPVDPAGSELDRTARGPATGDATAEPVDDLDLPCDAMDVGNDSQTVAPQTGTPTTDAAGDSTTTAGDHPSATIGPDSHSGAADAA